MYTNIQAILASLLAKKDQPSDNSSNRSQQKAKSGRMGGEATKRKYGSSHFSDIGRKGGLNKGKNKQENPNENQ